MRGRLIAATRVTPRLVLLGLLASPGAGSNAGAADTRPKDKHVAQHAAATSPPRPQPASSTENLVVHGQKRFVPAPMPNLSIHDPAQSLRDPNTGAALGRFGRAYNDANPVPPVNPALKGDQSPISAGVSR